MQQNFDMQQLMKLARSPVAQQLMAALNQSGGSNAEMATTMAKNGDMEGAKQALSGLLASEDIQKLLRQLEEQL